MLFDVLVAWIHVFRMPVFFLTAGFFAHLLYESRGAAGFARNRMIRVGAVLLLAVVPLYAALFLVVETYHRGGDADALRVARSAIGTPRFWGNLRLAHLWFLYYRLWFYAVVLVLARWGLPVKAIHWTRLALEYPGRAGLLLGVGFALLLATMPLGFLDTPHRIWPLRANIFAAYLAAFAFGWCVYAAREALGRLAPQGPLLVISGTGLVLAALPFLARKQTLVTALLIGPATWLLIFGVLGLFLRYGAQPNPRIRYLSDASYFLYLAHLPVVCAGVVALRPLPWPAIVKYSIVLSVSTALLLLSYQRFVRHTWIELLLNRRQARQELHPPSHAHAAPASEPSVP